MTLAGYWYCSPQAFKQHEHYTFYGFVTAMPNPGAETGIAPFYQPRFFSVLFTCGFGITTQRYNSEFHSCLLKSSISPCGVVWNKR